jgi:hypothetical protein
VADEVLPFSGDRGEGPQVAHGGNGIWGAGGGVSAGPADGEDLGALLRRRGRLPAGQAAVLVSQVAAALDAAHDAGLVHGTLSPAAIVVRAAGGGRAVLTGAPPGGPGGTLDYLAPEQIEGTGSGPRADQYALACVAYEILAGEPPFRRGDDIRLLRGQFAQTPLPLTSLAPDLPPEADLVLARAMARDPGDRYLRCLDFAAALTSACALDLDLIEPRPPVPAARPAPAGPGLTSGPLALSAVPQLVAAPVPLPSGEITAGWSPDPPQPAGPDVHGRPIRPGRREPRERRSPVLAVAILVVLLGIAGGTVMILRSGGLGSGRPQAGPARSPGAAAPRPPASSRPSGPPSPSPSPPRAAPRGPAGVVRAYFTAINRHDYRRAWRLGGHVSSATYGEFASGLGTTSRDTLVVLSVNEDTVTARLVAVQTDGSVKTYEGTYVVSDGVIAQASVRQID